MSGVERLRRFKARRGGSAAYRNSRRDSSPEERAKYLAWKAVEYAVRVGKLVKQACEDCGDPDAQAHHADYAKRLEVKWLCRKCHKLADKARRMLTA